MFKEKKKGLDGRGGIERKRLRAERKATGLTFILRKTKFIPIERMGGELGGQKTILSF